jgi:hypothetical protein
MNDGPLPSDPGARPKIPSRPYNPSSVFIMKKSKFFTHVLESVLNKHVKSCPISPSNVAEPYFRCLVEMLEAS